MRRRFPRQTVTYTDRGEPVAVELGAKRYGAYAQQAARQGVPVATVIRRDLQPLVAALRRDRRTRAAQVEPQP